MQLQNDQRCALCESAANGDPGCRITREAVARVAAIIAEANASGSQMRVKMPPVVLSVWCPRFWRKGRRHG